MKQMKNIGIYFIQGGMSYERSSKWELAEKDFLKALKLKPDQPLTLNYLGYSWIDLGKNIDEAHKLIQKAVKLRPNDGYFVDSLGWAYYRMGQYKKAVSELEKAVSLVPNDPIINDHLGDAMWRAGYKYEAIYQWKRALIYKPDDELENKIKFKLKKVYKLRLKTFNYISSKAFAKINLSLKVLGKTQDNYHSIESIITFLPDIYDCVMIKKSQKYKINITGKFSKTLNIEGGDTLVKNLVFLFKEKFNIPYNFNVIIKKNIPIGAGLGGGSADAAAIARLIIKIHKLKINKKEIINLLGTLGADIPACFFSYNQKVKGFGEKLTKLKLLNKKIWAVLIKPNINFNTKGYF